MLSVLFTICMIWFVGKFFIFGLKVSWGIMKLLCMIIFFPVILIGMVVGGLMYIAFPLLIIGGIIGLVTSHSKRGREVFLMGYDIEKEKREAIEAGRRALNSLSVAKENLNSAKNWGLVDMFGGGFFSTMLKHSKMDHAKQNMDQAKYDLRNFSKELNDVNMACDLHIDTGDFLSFADYFFDGFVVDWMVQDRINTAKRQVEEAIRRTESIVNQLQRM